MAKQKAPAQRNNGLFIQNISMKEIPTEEAKNPDQKGDPIKCYTRRTVEEHQAKIAWKREIDDLFGPE